MKAQTGFGNLPHGTVTAGCDFSTCQASEVPIVKNEMQKLIASLNTTSGDTRDLTNAALADLIMNPTDQTTAEGWINIAFQTLDSEGNVLQSVGYSGTKNDPNSTEFAMLGLGVLLSSGRLSFVDLHSATHANIKTAMTTLYNHINNSTSGPQLTQTSTNMYLMNTVARMLMSQGLTAQGVTGYTSDLTDAEDQLFAYLTYIQTYGVHEFDSPTYSATQLESLVEGYQWATTPNDQKNFRIALDYLWLDLAANFFQPGIRVAAPFSRNYDFISGQNTLGAWTEVMGGWTTEDYSGSYPTMTITGSGILNGGVLSLEGAELYDSITAGIPANAYVVPVSDYVLATTTGTAATRMIYQNWGIPTNDTITPTQVPMRWASIYNNLTLGCTSGYYGPQDKLFGVLLSGSTTSPGANRNLAIISNVLDSSGSPYGTVPQDGEDGSSKPDHVQENISCATSAGQASGTHYAQAAALVSTFFDASKRNPTDVGLSTNILFPVNTASLGDSTYPAVQVNGTALSSLSCNPVSADIITCPLSTSDVVTFQGINGGVAGFRLLESTVNATPTSPTGATAYQLEIDKDGSAPNPSGKSNDVGRIVITHAITPAGSHPPADPAWVTFLVVTDDAATSSTTVRNILSNATFPTPTVSGGNRTMVANFSSSYEPNTTLTSLTITRSDTVYNDIGSPVASPALPGHSGALTTYSLDGGAHRKDVASDFWTANPYTSTVSGFTCSVPLCSAP